MARIATLLLASVLTPMIDVGSYNVKRAAALTNGIAANGDYIPLFTLQRDGRIIGSKLAVSATLGAGAVVTLALYRAGVLVQLLTAASTAAAASVATGVAVANVDALAGDEIVLVVSGANITAAATATADVHVQH